MKMRTCHICGTVTDTWCPTCVRAFGSRRDAADMTADERAAEFAQLCGPLEIPFDQVHQRIEELVGRPVWTHELSQPEALVAEIRSAQRASFSEVLNKIPSDKQIVVVRP